MVIRKVGSLPLINHASLEAQSWSLIGVSLRPPLTPLHPSYPVECLLQLRPLHSSTDSCDLTNHKPTGLCHSVQLFLAVNPLQIHQLNAIKRTAEWCSGRPADSQPCSNPSRARKIYLSVSLTAKIQTFTLTHLGIKLQEIQIYLDQLCQTPFILSVFSCFDTQDDQKMLQCLS